MVADPGTDIRLSVVVATKNEAGRIERCLESVRWADEIVIVDDDSTDGTVEICRTFTQNITVNGSNGSFHENKNLGIEKANGEWILSLDADEVVPAELKEEILAALSSHSPDIDGYEITRRNYFLGRWIRGCGWYPDYIARLFRKGAAAWPLAIHDVPRISDPTRVRRMRNHYDHYSYTSMTQHFEKFNQYTSRLAAEEYGRNAQISGWRFFVYFLLKPLFWFFRKYFAQNGFRDGLPGFFISVSSAFTVFITYAKLWEMYEHRNQ